MFSVRLNACSRVRQASKLHTAHSTQHSALCTEHGAQSTEHGAWSTEHRAQSTEHKVHTTSKQTHELRNTPPKKHRSNKANRQTDRDATTQTRKQTTKTYAAQHIGINKQLTKEANKHVTHEETQQHRNKQAQNIYTRRHINKEAPGYLLMLARFTRLQERSPMASRPELNS